MKYKLLQTSTNDYRSSNIKEDILRFRGIKDAEKYLNVKQDVEISYKKLNNIDKAVECFIQHAENNDNMYIQVDVDVDGVTSASTLYNYIKRVYPKINIYWDIQNEKEHGVNLKQIPKDVKLVFIPDAGSNQYKEHKQLKEKGIDCIVLDHHKCKNTSKDAIIVNNQLSDEYTNKELSGVGIVYKFLQALDDELWLIYANDYIDLVALGLIADMMDIRNLETRYYINTGLKNIRNKCFLQLISKQQFSMKGQITPTSIGFYISPLINAMIRAGGYEEKKLMFRAFIEDYEEFSYKPRKSKNNPDPQDTIETIYERVARLCTNAKNRQDKGVKQGIELIKEDLTEDYLLNNKLLIFNIDGKLEKTYTGLVANKLAKYYMRPCILLRTRNNEKYGGSMRGLDNSEISDFQSFLQSLEIFDFVEGHENAAGVQLTKNKVDELIKKSNEKLKNTNLDKVYTVDYIVPFEDVSDEFIEEIYEMNPIWGQKLKETLIAIPNLKIETEKIKLVGDKMDTVVFDKEGLCFIKFKVTSEEYEKMIGSDDGWGSDLEFVALDIVGRCTVHDYNGERQLQIVIEDFELK